MAPSRSNSPIATPVLLVAPKGSAVAQFGLVKLVMQVLRAWRSVSCAVVSVGSSGIVAM